MQHTLPLVLLVIALHALPLLLDLTLNAQLDNSAPLDKRPKHLMHLVFAMQLNAIQATLTVIPSPNNAMPSTVFALTLTAHPPLLQLIAPRLWSVVPTTYVLNALLIQTAVHLLPAPAPRSTGALPAPVHATSVNAPSPLKTLIALPSPSLAMEPLSCAPNKLALPTPIADPVSVKLPPLIQTALYALITQHAKLLLLVEMPLCIALLPLVPVSLKPAWVRLQLPLLPTTALLSQTPAKTVSVLPLLDALPRLTHADPTLMALAPKVSAPSPLEPVPPAQEQLLTQ